MKYLDLLLGLAGVFICDECTDISIGVILEEGGSL